MALDASTTHLSLPHKENVSELYQFFALRLRELETLGYSELDTQEYHKWHHPHVLISKLHDSTRFFQVVYNKKKEIIGYFESKQSSDNTYAQVVQWIMVREDYRKHGIAKELYRSFEIWCQEKGYTMAKSCTTVQNTVSQQMHTTLGFYKIEQGNDVIWFKKEIR